MGEKGATFVRKAFEIDGITRIFVSSYHASIEISPAFLWEEIEPELIRLFKEVYELEDVEFFSTGMRVAKSVADEDERESVDDSES